MPSLLYHDMTLTDPYPNPRNQQQLSQSTSLPAGYNPATGFGYDNRFPRMKFKEPPIPPLQMEVSIDDTRANLRAKNYHGTLGSILNFDGTVSGKPVKSMNHSNSMEDVHETIFTGGHSKEIRGPVRHGPGIQSSLYSDSAEQQERKRILQQELAEYERIQLMERAAKKEAERRQELEPRETRRFALEKIEEYSKELKTGDNQRRFNQHAQPNNPPPEPVNFGNRRNPTESERYDPISHAPISSKQPLETRRKRLQVQDEREAVYPLRVTSEFANSSKTYQPPPPPDTSTLNKIGFTTEYRTQIHAERPTENSGPTFGRRRILDVNESEERAKYEQQARRLLQNQEEDLRRRKESQLVNQMRELEIGRQYASSYPWDWGHDDTTKKDPRHRSTDISRKTEPLDRNKAMQYHHELDQLRQERLERERGERERERGYGGSGSSVWDRFK
ncbi:hypothetical protein HDU97_005385 [Phlyctochytrium planicorne]|nr:hypothetical protein HDU97_005385 [Phlyctochytrium planicorne]